MLDKELTDLLDGLFEGAYIVDDKRKILYWNSGAEKITGYNQEEVLYSNCFDNILRHVDDKGNELCFKGCPLQQTISTGEILNNKVYLHHKLGHRVPVFVRTSPLYDDEGKIYAALEVFTDIGFQRALYTENQRLQELTTKDQLTDTFNRSYIDYQVDSFINEFDAFSQSFGVVFIDIDDFKKVNDTYGHSVGDEVLKLVCRTIKSNIRDTDILGRYGGEEFLLLFKISSDAELMSVSNKIRFLVEQSSLAVEDELIKVTISMGASMFQIGDNKERLINRADKAMYQSKQTGKNKVTLAGGES